jgi:glycosyltransferase involved in cell wall biosynthesis
MHGAHSNDQPIDGVLALNWFEHRRTRELCAGLGIELVRLSTTYRGLRRYLLLTAHTVALLFRRRPDVLLVQSPSLVLGILALVLRGALGYRLVVDAHNEAVEPHENRQAWIRWLSRWVIRRADLTIVTNRQLAQIVVRQGGRAFILPDRIPAAAAGGPTRTLGPGFNVVLIATFARDEPVAAILEAVRGVELELFVTGNPRKLRQDVAARAPPNVHFTGFLAEGDYWDLLRAADAVVDLTLKPDCLVCGAYEALAVGKPMLLSNNVASLELFGESALFTDNTVRDIRHSFERLKSESAPLKAAVTVKRSELTAVWSLRANDLAAMLRQWCAGIRSERVV